MPRPTRADLLADVEALRGSLAKEAARRKRLERKLAREPARRAPEDQAEARAYDDALGEIFRLITSSPGEPQLVFEAITRHARTLCPAASSVERILEKGANTRETLLREVRDLVAARVARQGRSR